VSPRAGVGGNADGRERDVRHGDGQVTVRMQAERLDRTSPTASERILTAVGQAAAGP
jgi:hypothetical protein